MFLLFLPERFLHRFAILATLRSTFWSSYRGRFAVSAIPRNTSAKTAQKSVELLARKMRNSLFGCAIFSAMFIVHAFRPFLTACREGILFLPLAARGSKPDSPPSNRSSGPSPVWTKHDIYIYIYIYTMSPTHLCVALKSM